jgi:type I restriction enzyme, S subunit
MKAYRLSDQNVFRTLNGLWTGKKEPLVKACVLRNTNFGPDGILDPSDVAKLQVEKRQLDKRQLQRGDIILERSGGSPKQPVGRVAFFDLDSSDPFSFSNFTSALRVIDRSLFEPRFVHYFLLDFYFEGGTKPLQSNTTGLRNLNFDSYIQTEVPCPPIDEQRKIAAVLGKVQAAVAVEGDLVRVTRELKQAALRQLFTRGLRHEPQKQTALGPVPESWNIVQLSKAAFLQRGRFTHRPRNEPRFYGGKTPFVQTGDVVRSDGWIREHTQTLTDEGVAISRVFPAGTILITIAANIGYSGVLTFACAAPDSLVGISANEDFDTTYLSYYLQTQQKRMDELAPRGTQKNINIQFLTPWPVPKPALAEQREIAALLATLDAKIAHHEARQALLRELFRTLLHDLLTARRRVTSLDLPNLVPAST